MRIVFSLHKRKILLKNIFCGRCGEYFVSFFVALLCLDIGGRRKERRRRMSDTQSFLLFCSPPPSIRPTPTPVFPYNINNPFSPFFLFSRYGKAGGARRKYLQGYYTFKEWGQLFSKNLLDNLIKPNFWSGENPSQH